MAWIESHQELRNHPKLSALCRTLEVEKATVVGHLHFLWWWCMDYAMDGNLARYDRQQIADAAEWKGDAEVFVTSLLKAGFLDLKRENIHIHDWFDFCGEIVNKRLRRKEEKRQKSADFGSRNSPNFAERSPTVPDRTVPNLTNNNTGAGISAPPYKRPEKTSDPIGFLVLTYKEGLGVAVDDRDWDKQFWGRWSKQAKLIYDSLGNVNDAVGFLNYHAKGFTEKGLNWNLRTIADRAVLYAAKKRGKNDTPNRKRVSDVDDDKKSDSQSDGLREPPTGRQILDAIRGGKEIPDGV